MYVSGVQRSFHTSHSLTSVRAGHWVQTGVVDDFGASLALTFNSGQGDLGVTTSSTHEGAWVTQSELGSGQRQTWVSVQYQGQNVLGTSFCDIDFHGDLQVNEVGLMPYS
ncbi:hypothetical protein D3C78_1197350 [compost metagenome]